VLVGHGDILLGVATPVAVGTRLVCAQCNTEIIVVKASEGEIACCGSAMTPVEKK